VHPIDAGVNEPDQEGAACRDGQVIVIEGDRVSAALTARRSAVLVRGRGAAVLLSPADPDGLVRALAKDVA